MRAVILEATVLICACVAAHAQERRPCTGRVVDAAGESVAAATVTLVGTPAESFPAAPHVVTLTADERGRFVAGLLSGEVYTAWAVGPLHDDGTAAVSEPLDLVVAGQVLELRIALEARVKRLHILARDDWREVGPCAVRVFPDSRHDFGLDLAIDERGFVTVPPIVHANSSIALLDAGGGVCAIEPLGEGIRATAVRFDTPRRLSARVVGPGREPLAGAIVESACVFTATGSSRPTLDPWAEPRAIETWRRVAVTDGDGIVTGRFAATLLRVSAGGCRPEYFDARPGAVPKVFALERAGSVRIRVVGGVPARELPLEVLAPVWVNSPYRVASPFTMTEYLQPWPLTRRSEDEWSALAPARPRLIPRIRVADDRGVPTRFEPLRFELSSEAVTIDLSTLTRWQIQVVDSDGAPTPAVIGVATVGPLWRTTTFDLRVATDPRGRAELWLPANDRVIYATTGTTHVAALAAADDDERALRLVLEPIPSMRLRILDSIGQPAAGVRASLVIETVAPRADSNPVAGLLARVALTFATTQGDRWRSAQDGSLSLPAISHPGLRSRASLSKGSLNATIELKAGADVQVELR